MVKKSQNLVNVVCERPLTCYQNTVFVFFCFYNANSRQEYFFYIYLERLLSAGKKYQFCLQLYQILNLSYQTTLCFIFVTAKWIWDISIFSSIKPKLDIRLFVDSAKQFYEHSMQKLAKTGKYTKINKQSHVKFWLNWRKYKTVSYSFSCNLT